MASPSRFSCLCFTAHPGCFTFYPEDQGDKLFTWETGDIRPLLGPEVAIGQERRVYPLKDMVPTGPFDPNRADMCEHLALRLYKAYVAVGATPLAILIGHEFACKPDEVSAPQGSFLDGRYLIR